MSAAKALNLRAPPLLCVGGEGKKAAGALHRRLIGASNSGLSALSASHMSVGDRRAMSLTGSPTHPNTQTPTDLIHDARRVSRESKRAERARETQSFGLKFRV